MTVFPLLSRPGAYLISKLLGAGLVKGWHLKENGLFQTKENKGCQILKLCLFYFFEKNQHERQPHF